MSKARGLVFGVTILVMSSKLDINIFGNFKVSSLLDTGILHTARAATGTTTTMKLKDLPIGGVINLGAYNYVKIADNQFMQTEVAACPDGKTVAGKYVKCFEDSSAYTQTCTGSYYCNTSNTAWNSSTGKCDSSVTCPDGSTYCGDHSQWDSGTSKCIGVGSCGNNAYITDAISNVCTCAPGYYANTSGSGSTALGGSCGYVACSSGTYANASGLRYIASGSTCTYKQCSGTNVNTSTYTNANSCSCASNYYSSNAGSKTTTVGGACEFTACTSNKYADASGHQYTSTGSCTYIACGANATTTYGDGSCTCNSGYSWNSETSACEEVKCGEHSTQSGDSCLCDSGYVTSSYTTSYSTGSANGACSVATMQDWTGCSSLATNATTTLYDTAGKKVYTVKKFADGNCYTYDDVSVSSSQSNAVSLCSNISGWSLPTKDQFDNLISAVGAANMNSAWCNNQCSSERDWWSSTANGGRDNYSLYVGSSDAYTFSLHTEGSARYRVRCMAN